MDQKMFIYSMPGFDDLSEILSEKLNAKKGNYKLERFTNNEAQISIDEDVKKNECLVLGTNAPPDSRMLELLILCHTLWKEKAKKVTAGVPYLAYTRQDKKEIKKSFFTDWFAKIAKASAISEIITVDIHSQLAKKLFKIPVISLSPAKIFADEIKKIAFDDATIIAPDEGAIKRAQDVKRCLGSYDQVSYFEKRRNGQVITGVFKGKVGKRAVIIDDILDTGGTLIVVCQELRKLGVQEIIIMVTHGLFTNDNWKELWNLGVKKIYATDTFPGIEARTLLGVSILSVASILEKHLNK